MRVFRNAWFSRFARREKISDHDLCEAVDRAERGLIDADLGGDVIKQRIARFNKGRSGGFRSIILFRVGERVIFVFGFAKNKTENISAHNLKAFKILAKTLLNHDDEEIQRLIERQELTEVECDEENL